MNRLNLCRLLSVATAFVAVGLLAGCGGEKKSGREIKRDEIRSQAAQKRKELAPVAGIFSGEMITASGEKTPVSLQLEIKDMPQTVETGVDPVIVPVLRGALQLHLGDQEDSGSQVISFAMAQTDYDPGSRSLDLTAINSVYEQIFLDLNHQNPAVSILSGDWNLPSESAVGTIRLERELAGLARLQNYLGRGYEGRYTGYANHSDRQAAHLANLQVTLTDQAPDAVETRASLRIFFGGRNSPEYRTFNFPDVTLRPLVGRLSGASADGAVALEGRIEDGCFAGSWRHIGTGHLGPVHSCLPEIAVPESDFALQPQLSGQYRGALSNTASNVNLPERMQVGLVASGVANEGGAFRLTGNVRFYLGGFDGNEYFESPLSEVRYDIFTRAFSAKVDSDYQFSLVGTLNQGQLAGDLIQDGSGVVATFSIEIME